MNVLRLPDYRAWLVADTATALTNSVRVVALPLLAFHLTGSTLQAGVLASVTSAVGVVTSLAGGVLADSVDRRRVMLWYAAGGTLVWGLGSVLLWQGWLTFALLMVLQVGSTINGGLFGVGSNAALRSIVADEEYPQAMAANQARDSVIGIVGGPLGGVLYSWTMVAPFVASVVGYLAMALGVLRIRTDLRPNAPDEAREAVPAWRGMSAGFTFLWTNTVVRSFALIALVVNFAGALIFTATNLYLVAIGTEPTLIGLVDSIAGAAMLLGAVAAGWVVSRIPTGWLTVATVAWMAAATALIAIVPSYGGDRGWVGGVGTGVGRLWTAALGHGQHRVGRHGAVGDGDAAGRGVQAGPFGRKAVRMAGELISTNRGQLGDQERQRVRYDNQGEE